MKKSNNKGFTLIEILVAIVALALVIVPLLQGFVATANLNRKSRERMMATNVAQTHMEEYSGLTIEEIDKKCKAPLLADPSTYTFVENTIDYKYSYAIENYSHNGKNYDIRLSIDALPYYTDTLDGAGNIIDKGINNVGFAEVTSVDVTQDGIYPESDNVFEAAKDAFLLRSQASTTAPAHATDASVFEDELNRSIVIKIEDKPDGTETYTEVSVQYTYICSDSSPYLGTGDDKEYTKSIIIFSNQKEAPEDRKLRNVYLLFKPYYDRKSYDTITVENYNNKKVNVYLIKLNNHSADLFDLENGYVAPISVRESTTAEWNAPNFKAYTKIFTNLGYNLAIEDENDPLRDVGLQTTYLYYPSSSPSATPQNDKIDYDYFVPEYTEARMYNMKVEVYNAGAADNSFPDTEKLAELSN